MEKWQREGYDSFGAWRRADQKRRDDEKKAARADAAAAAAAAPLLPPPPQPVVLAMPIPEGVRDVRVKDVRGCPGPTCSLTGVTGCSLYGTKHVHCKRVRVATVPIASVVRLLPIPVTPTTVTETDGMAGSPPRQKLGTLYERVDVTPGGSRVHTLERTTPRGSRLTFPCPGPAPPRLVPIVSAAARRGAMRLVACCPSAGRPVSRCSGWTSACRRWATASRPTTTWR